MNTRPTNPKVWVSRVVFLMAGVLLFSCACAAPIVPPSALRYTPAVATYIVGTPIAPATPSSTGPVTAYGVKPVLPAGLKLNVSTGIVSGTPVAPAAMTKYVVTASNAAGSATAALTITVNAAVPDGLAYSSTTAFYIVGTPITADVPSSTGGAITAYSVSPALPAGLSLNRNTGAITGTPTTVTAMNTYTVTASNASGTATERLNITVLVASPAGLAYNPSAPVYIAGVPISNTPTNSGGPATQYAMGTPLNPSGPTLAQLGLAIDPGTGIVTGTPVSGGLPTDSPVTVSFPITASNSTGSTTAMLTITVYNSPQLVPNMNQWITPLATPGSIFEFLDTGEVVGDALNTQLPPVEWLAGQAVSTAVSPDGHWLLVLTSGYNRVYQAVTWNPTASTEYVFIYDISNGAPVLSQRAQLPNSYNGVVWDTGKDAHGNYNQAFYVSSGMGNWPYDSLGNFAPQSTNNGDNLHVVARQPNGIWAETPGKELALAHHAGNGLPVPSGQSVSGNGAFVNPCAAGVAISSDGQTLVVANYYNDSITRFTGGFGKWSTGTELDLRPGKSVSSPEPGTPGGEYPFWVVVKGAGGNTLAYVSSVRDREIDVVKLKGTPVVAARIAVKGQPNKMTMNQAQTLLYVAEDETDTVDVIDINSDDTGYPKQSGPTTFNTVVETIPVIAPESVLSNFSLTQYTGANTNSVTLAEPGENYLYVTNGNLNNVAVIALRGTTPPSGDEVIGLIPTGWYPSSVSLSNDGTWAYVVNSKSPTGANSNWCYSSGPAGYPGCQGANEYDLQLTKAGLQGFPLAGAMAQLTTLTTQVTTNNRFSDTSTPDTVMTAVHAAIKHVILVVKENRSYDQILGDLPVGNGDANMALFGSVTPNQHALAQTFVTLDNFLTTAEGGNDGWAWTTGARAPDVVERQYPVFAAQRGLSLDSEGLNRSINVALPTFVERKASDPLTPQDPDLLPGQTDIAAPDGPNDELNTGYLWNAALRANLTVRNYGFLVDVTCYNEPACQIPLAENPFATRTMVAFPANTALADITDFYFRGFDNAFPDFFRYQEWSREFNTKYAAGGLPALSLVRFMHDSTGSFATAIDGVNTPERQLADNDYAVGLLVQTIANSAVYKDNTLIFVVEDDAQDGGDHVDSHRSPAFVAGAYVRQGYVDSTAHNTLDFLRTIEEVLGLEPMNLNDALATPMTEIFNSTATAWSFTATPASILYCTSLPLPPPEQSCNEPKQNAK